MPKIYEYRGVEGLVYAEVLTDDKNGITFGEVKDLVGVAEIGKTTESTSEAHYYDNIPAVIITSTGADTITISASAIPLDVLAEITGQTYDATTDMFIEEEREQKHFAIGYQTKTTDGQIIYVWRLKGSFNIPDQTNGTENAGTDANGQELTFTGINTIHKFTKTGKTAKAVNVNTAKDKAAQIPTFFDTVQTPDTITAAAVTPSVTVIPSNASVEIGETITLQAVTVPAGETVTWTSSDNEKASVVNGVVSGVASGTVTITAAITVDGTQYTDTATVAVPVPEA